tara:strand:- start:525 stop:665 length:141 start_codon:yes stop_codon:yes gene_type:complete
MNKKEGPRKPNIPQGSPRNNLGGKEPSPKGHVPTMRNPQPPPPKKK